MKGLGSSVFASTCFLPVLPKLKDVRINDSIRFLIKENSFECPKNCNPRN